MTSNTGDLFDADATDAQQATSSITFCSLFSEQQGVDPVGSAWANNHYVMIEIPLPWPYDIYESKRAPAGIKDYLYGLWDRGISIAGVAFAPDPEWSVPGHTRVIDFNMPESPLTRFSRKEFLVPTERTTDAVRTLVEEEDDSWLDSYRCDISPDMRDMFVCTHGAIDACCATFGYPLYKLLRHMTDGAPTPMRVWRCSHFGGHQFAATMTDFPEGRYWGHLKAQDLANIVARKKPFAEVRKKYRGWAGVPMGLAQVAEAAALEHFGWDWTRFVVSSTTLPAYIYGSKQEPAVVLLNYLDPETGVSGEITIEVAPDGFITSMHSSALEPETYEAQQYRAEILSVREAQAVSR
jgi:hypothetical protein